MSVNRRKSLLSTVYISVRWRASVNLVAQPVRIALVPTSRVLVPADWRAAAWESDPAVANTNATTAEVTYTRVARVLAGPAAAFNPPPGRYGVHAELTDNPEVPVLTPDELGYIDVI